MIVSIDLSEAVAKALDRIAGAQGLTSDQWLADRLADHFGLRSEPPFPTLTNDDTLDD